MYFSKRSNDDTILNEKKNRVLVGGRNKCSSALISMETI